jgi:hypothetical protein
MSRHVSGIACPSSGGIKRTQNWWLLCAVVDVGWSVPISWDQPTTTTAHNNHQLCVRVVPPEDGQVKLETRRYIEHQ